MRNPPRPMRTPLPQSSTTASAKSRRAIGALVRKGAGHAHLAPLLALLYFLFYTNIPDNLYEFSLKPSFTTGAIDRIAKIAAILLSLGLIASKWSLTRQFLKEINPGLAAFMVLIPMSFAWSGNPDATLLRFITLFGIVLTCTAIALARWDPQRFQKTALPPVMAILIVSLMIGMIAPSLVKETGDDISLANAWRGITFQKNQFGMTASFGAVLCCSRLLGSARFSFWTVTSLAISLLCLALSRSSTSLIATVLALFFMVLVMRIPIVKSRFTTPVTIGVFAIIIIYNLAIQNLIPGVYTLLKPVMELTGKDMTFSARSVIWEVVKEHSRAAPWLGSGYGAYWAEESPNSPSYVFVWLMSFWPSEAHNGYLEILNDLGRVGLACLLVFLVWFLRQALQLMQFDRTQAVLYLALLYQQMVANLSESEWFSRTTISSLLILASVCMSRSLAEYRLQAQPANANARLSRGRKRAQPVPR